MVHADIASDADEKAGGGEGGHEHGDSE